jgi:hypothetical protein
MRGTFLSVLLLLLAALLPLRAETRSVDVALVLAIDISASIDASEHSLQMAGLAAALQSPEVREAIEAGPHRRIAIAVTQWSGLHMQRLVVPWTIVDGDEAARKLAVRVLAAPRADPGGGTSISLALEHAAGLFASAPPANRRVIDLSTDGINNIGPPLDSIRRQMKRQQITVNGLAISNEWPRLQDYLDERVITGTAAFSIEAAGFPDFEETMRAKLLREISGPGLS